MSIIYLAGPITSKLDTYRETFSAEAEYLRTLGHTVLNPAMFPSGLTEAAYMDIGFAMMRACDTIHMLPGWSESEGARAEHAYAVKLGMIVVGSVE